mmetsp:Transcript_99362/g.206976  ORF Transcript_99362/g.206976 Transcript_99362/m.206976 type:complete len:755 (-) Transcript_99362:277-2541(-)
MGGKQSCGKTCSNCAADCARASTGYADDFDDERPGGDPAGATFEETLEDLNGLDRQLMLFCATSNLAAVRWLLHLGAHWDACDANGTTCLHVACRAGTLAIVKELLRYPDLLHSVDAAGWTPLHIAVLMGRRGVVVRLLQAGAPLHVRNGKGQEPTELCADSGTYDAIRAYEAHMQTSPNKAWDFSKEVGPGEDVIGSRLQYEPFFVPRQPIVRTQQYKKEFQRIGMLMFNAQPGFGLAFLVAAGVARDYPVDMSNFLRRSKVDIRQVGCFLGEAFSLSHTIRLEFINSVVLQNTGIVSALIQVFHMLQLPDDLQKINRLVHGVARIWWRQHERVQKDLASGFGTTRRLGQGHGPQLHFSDELVGLELKQYLTSSDALHQLMFSTVLLHWYVYRDGGSTRNDLPYQVWKKMNVGLEEGGGDVPDHIQQQIYAIVCRAFIPELSVAPGQAAAHDANAAAVAAVAASRSGRGGGGGDVGGLLLANRPYGGAESLRVIGGPGDAAAGGSVSMFGPRAGHPSSSSTASTPPLGVNGKPCMLTPFSAMEGWAQIVGGGFPRPTGLSGMQTVTYKHVSSIFSEVTHSTSSLPFHGSQMMGAGENGNGSMHSVATGLPATTGKLDDHAWLSLCCTLLFFSAPQMGVPYAFLELKRALVSALDEESRVMTVVGAPEAEDDLDSAAGPVAFPLPSGRTVPVSIVLLLPDGRWQEMSLPKLDLRLATSEDLQKWTMHLTAASQGKVPTTQVLSGQLSQVSHSLA